MEQRQIFYRAEVDEFARVFYKPESEQRPGDHAKMNAIIDPVVRRFSELDEDEQELFRKEMVAYKNLYAFLSQIIPFQDSDLEKLYSFIRFFLTKIPRTSRGPIYHFDDEVALKYYRIEKTSDQVKIELQKGKVADVSGPTEVGTGCGYKEKIPLSKLIDILNERFGTEFKPADQLFFDSIKEDAMADSRLRKAAEVNTLENFGHVFKKALDDLFIDRMDANDEIVAKFMNEDDFRKIVIKYLTRQVWEGIRKEHVK